ncbi:AraC family transcriptional regulator [Salinibacter sp. 10B]|uniref:AraC family transcriptional regulator n=1 Tax=Salinibacter sp. 10B TaxID=1923971 RepID=UPI000CF553B4|nr:AraC family transcriptional regulator [Salinibacter sp. 10B]PQJ35354.1 AraC family transcriptional regulator [Salinibacter sp. 10B]
MNDSTDSPRGHNESVNQIDKREELQMQAHRAELVDRISRAVPEDDRVEVLDGLTLHRRSQATEPLHNVAQPALCVMAQGAKVVQLGDNHYRYDPYHYLLITSKLPMAGEIVEASEEEPYLCMILSLDADLVSSVMVEGGYGAPAEGDSVRALDISPLGPRLLDAAVRLVRLLDHPEEVDVLKPLILREIVFRLLQGEQGHRLRHFAMMEGGDHRIAQAIQRFHQDFDQSIKIERLAEEVGMSESSFYQHFKAVTGMTPLKFQKQLRLQEARRLMLSEDLNASTAGYRVGYNDVPHFSREYKRLFGDPPKRDVEQLQQTTG